MESIKKLKDLFGRFPTIGSRTAGRFVYYLINQPKEKVDELVLALQELKKNVKLCAQCFNPFENSEVSDTSQLCAICRSPARAKDILCIVEKEADLISIENTGRYKGLYFILGGSAPVLKPQEHSLRLKELQERIKITDPTEIIIALNPTPEGKTASFLVERALKAMPATAKITHLAKGLPVGGELEYADEETLESAFEGRK